MPVGLLSQRIGLAVGAVVGLSQENPALLPQRLTRSQADRQGGRLVDAALAQQRLDQPFLGPVPQLGKASGLVSSFVPALQVQQGIAFEEGETVSQERHGARRLTDLDHVGRLLHGVATEQQLGVSSLASWLRQRIADASTAP